MARLVEELRSDAESADRPVGLRHRKKQQQRNEILAAAMELLRERGYDKCRIEDIASVANVSLKTVYNYFASKQAILIELLRDDRLRIRGAYDEIAKAPPDDIAEALARLLHADVGDVVGADNKKLWRELLAAETRTHEKQGDEFEKNREIFTDYVRSILLHFRKCGKLSPAVRIDLAVDMIYAIMAFNFRQYCAIEEMTPAELLKTTRKQMKLLLAPWTVS
jgi:AcrR family transcriptional regulator